MSALQVQSNYGVSTTSVQDRSWCTSASVPWNAGTHNEDSPPGLACTPSYAEQIHQHTLTV